MSSDGQNYAPVAHTEKVCGPGEFVIAAAGLTHGHINGMCKNLISAGAELKWAWDENPELLDRFVRNFPDVKKASSLAEILNDPAVKMVASADIPYLRGALGVKVLNAGKHYFSDKAPFTTLEQIDAAREACERTGLKWAVCYSERLQNEAAVFAGELIKTGRIGKVIQVLGLGPHRHTPPQRMPYFYKREQYGGILCDIGSHQIEQFLYFAGASSAELLHANVANYNHPATPEFNDFGDARLTADNGAVCYFRVDWFTPKGLGTWGDGRTFVTGTEGYLELRKYVDIARETTANHVYLVDSEGEHHFPVDGTVGFPYFPQLIRDCLEGTDLAMPREHAFLAAELSIKAQLLAEEQEKHG